MCLVYVQSNVFSINKELCMTSGTIPLQLLRMKVQGKNVLLPTGLMLPENIGDVGDGIARLDLSDMGLIGECAHTIPTYN
jgi:hypothetical protein